MKNPANRRFAEADGNEKNGKALTTSALGSNPTPSVKKQDTHIACLVFYAKKMMKNPANRRFAEADGNEKNGKALTTSALGSESHSFRQKP